MVTIPDNIENRIELLEKVWRLESTASVAYQVVPLAKRPVGVSLFDLEADPELSLKMQLRDLEAAFAFPGHFVPLVVPDCTTLAVASAFGGDIVWADKDVAPWVKPVLCSPGDALKLGKPKLNQGLIRRCLERVSYFCKQAPKSFFIRSVNYQGPITNASELWGDQEFLTAILDYPREVHATLDVVTDFMLDFIQAQAKIVGPDRFVPNLCHPDWLPPGLGIGVADDYLAILSPSQYEEFALPYNNRLSEAFGGIHLHSCGNIAHNYENVLKHQNLRGINCDAAENELDKLIATFSGKAVLAPYAGLHARGRFHGAAGYIEELLKHKRTDTAVVATLYDWVIDNRSGKEVEDPSLSKALGLLNQYNERQ